MIISFHEKSVPFQHYNECEIVVTYPVNQEAPLRELAAKFFTIIFKQFGQNILYTCHDEIEINSGADIQRTHAFSLGNDLEDFNRYKIAIQDAYEKFLKQNPIAKPTRPSTEPYLDTPLMVGDEEYKKLLDSLYPLEPLSNEPLPPLEPLPPDQSLPALKTPSE